MGGGPPSHSPAVSLRFLFATEIAAAAREAIVRLLGRGMGGAGIGAMTNIRNWVQRLNRAQRGDFSKTKMKSIAAKLKDLWPNHPPYRTELAAVAMQNQPRVGY